MNVKTPGAVRRTGAFESVIVGTSDASDIAHHAQEIQIQRLRRQFNLPPAVAAATAALLYPQVDSWRAGR